MAEAILLSEMMTGAGVGVGVPVLMTATLGHNIEPGAAILADATAWDCSLRQFS
jgi:hypothetical protein